MAASVIRVPGGWRATDTLGRSGFRVVAIYPDTWPPVGPTSLTIEPNWADSTDAFTALGGNGISRNLLLLIGLDDGMYTAVRAAMVAEGRGGS